MTSRPAFACIFIAYRLGEAMTLFCLIKTVSF